MVLLAWLGLVALGSWLGSPEESVSAGQPEQTQAEERADESDGAEPAEPAVEPDSESGTDDTDGTDGTDDTEDVASQADQVVEPGEVVPEWGWVEVTGLEDSSVDRLQRQFAGLDTELALAYMSGPTTVVLDIGRGELLTADLGHAGAVALRPGGDGPRGTAPGRSAVLAVAATRIELGAGLDWLGRREDGATLVADPVGGSYVVADRAMHSQGSLIHYVDASGMIETVDPPLAYLVDGYPGLGLVATPRVPGQPTLVSEGPEFVPFSAGEVFAAGAHSVAERLCDGDGCASQVRNLETGETYPIPPDFMRIGDRFSLAPDGLKLLRTTEQGFAEVLKANGDRLFVSSSWATDAVWTPDSQSVVWIDFADSPSLRFMSTDSRAWNRLLFGGIGAPLPTSGDLVAFDGGAGDGSS